MKYFFVDIDGVIYKNGKINDKVIKLVKNNKNKLIFCSGRGYIRCLEIIGKYLNNNSIIIVENGSKIVKNDGKTIYYKKINNNDISILKDIDFTKLEYIIFNPLYNNYYISYSKSNLKYVKKNYKYYSSFYKRLIKSKTTQICIKTNNDYLETIIDIFNRNKINYSLSEGNILINGKNINKKSGVIKVLNKDGINLEDVVLIGNDSNDISMFKLNAKYKIAVVDQNTPLELINNSTIQTDFDKLFGTIKDNVLDNMN